MVVALSVRSAVSEVVAVATCPISTPPAIDTTSQMSIINMMALPILLL
jgi:hypothetical protein